MTSTLRYRRPLTEQEALGAIEFASALENPLLKSGRLNPVDLAFGYDLKHRLKVWYRQWFRNDGGRLALSGRQKQMRHIKTALRPHIDAVPPPIGIRDRYCAPFSHLDTINHWRIKGEHA
jgi:hypothetical protein